MAADRCDFHEDQKEELKDHERRLGILERNSAEFTVRIQNLCEKLDAMVGWLKAVFLLGATTLVGFVIWYIQHLGTQLANLP